MLLLPGGVCLIALDCKYANNYHEMSHNVKKATSNSVKHYTLITQ